ncbi:hypothetical protein [Vibrio nereis]|nr:hypothetical protein [Vibrio nereis]
MKLKVYFSTGKTVTYHSNVQALMKSFDSAGIKYDLVESDSILTRSPR